MSPHHAPHLFWAVFFANIRAHLLKLAKVFVEPLNIVMKLVVFRTARKVPTAAFCGHFTPSWNRSSWSGKESIRAR